MLIVLAAVGGAFEVVVGDEAAASWFAALAVALVVLPLLARSPRSPHPVRSGCSPLGSHSSVGMLAGASVFVAGMLAAFLLGNLRDIVQARIGLAIVLGGAAIIVYNDPTHAPSFTPVLFAIAWLAGFAARAGGANRGGGRTRRVRRARARRGGPHRSR